MTNVLIIGFVIVPAAAFWMILGWLVVDAVRARLRRQSEDAQIDAWVQVYEEGLGKYAQWKAQESTETALKRSQTNATARDVSRSQDRRRTTLRPF